MLDFYDLGYQAGAADVDPVPLVGDTQVTAENMKDYLAGWVLGQAWLRRSKEYGFDPGDGPHKWDGL